MSRRYGAQDDFGGDDARSRSMSRGEVPGATAVPMGLKAETVYDICHRRSGALLANISHPVPIIHIKQECPFSTSCGHPSFSESFSPSAGGDNLWHSFQYRDELQNGKVLEKTAIHSEKYK